MFIYSRASSEQTSLDQRYSEAMAQTVKRLPAMQETQVQFLGQEDPLEKEMAIHSSILCLENPMDRGAWRATVHGVAKSWTGVSKLHTQYFFE